MRRAASPRDLLVASRDINSLDPGNVGTEVDPVVD